MVSDTKETLVVWLLEQQCSNHKYLKWNSLKFLWTVMDV